MTLDEQYEATRDAARPATVPYDDAPAWVASRAVMDWPGRVGEYIGDAEACGYLVVLPAAARDGRLHVAALAR